MSYMPTIDFELDTRPMAQSLDRVGNHVNATTVAVTAMQAAVIKTEKESADRICANVDKGFFNLIRSQISSKLAKQFTEMNATFMLLMQFSKSLAATGDRMESDVYRLKRQYYKIFHGLDKSLENRVAQLDKPAMDLAAMRKTIITGRSLKTVATAVCTEQESSATNQMLITARLKEKTGAALQSIGTNIYDNGRYLNNVSNMLHQEDIAQREELYIPVICVEEQSQVFADSSYAHAVYPEYMDQQTKNAVERIVNPAVGQLLSEGKNQVHSEEVKSAFYDITNRSDLDERTVEVMMSLFEKGVADEL